jgi:N-acetylneuraminate synthase
LPHATIKEFKLLELSKWYDQLSSGENVRPILIGEIGVNHNGSLETALEMIDMAVENGCDLVKFQKRNPDICVPEAKKSEMRETPWGYITYLEYKKKIEFEKEEFDKINAHCSKMGVGWSASAWDLDSQKFLSPYNLGFNKVASAMNTNVPLLEMIASEKKLTFLSTGMSEISDIDRCVEIFEKKSCPVILLHTVSTYPAAENELNLRNISMLQKRYGHPVGYSGHEPSVSPSIVAAAIGAVVIERHVTLDRSMWGTDQSASLEPQGLRYLSSVLGKVQTVLGQEEKIYLESEKKAARNLRYW